MEDRLMVDETSVYEIDEECLRRRREEKKDRERRSGEDTKKRGAHKEEPAL